MVALAASADAVVLEAPFYGSEDVLLAAAALLAPAASTALTARRSGKMKMLRSSKPPKLVLAGEAKDLYLDRKAGAACGLLAARGRAAAALFWTSGARGAAAPLDEVMAHLRPWSSRCEHVKAASAAFTHEPCSCGSPAPRSGPGVAPAATSIRCSPEALYGSGAAEVAFWPAPLQRGSTH